MLWQPGQNSALCCYYYNEVQLGFLSMIMSLIFTVFSGCWVGCRCDRKATSEATSLSALHTCDVCFLTRILDIVWKALRRLLGFPGGSDGKESACNAGDPGSIPGREDPVEKGMATHSSILAWRIPWQRSLVGYRPWVAQSGTQLSNLTLFHTCHLFLCLLSSVLQKS